LKLVKIKVSIRASYTQLSGRSQNTNRMLDRMRAHRA
jgi:hypothetical protein